MVGRGKLTENYKCKGPEVGGVLSFSGKALSRRSEGKQGGGNLGGEWQMK